MRSGRTVSASSFRNWSANRRSTRSRDTLDLIESLAPLHVIPGHGQVFHDAPAALRKARSRLEGFQQQPAKHARHALKVLLKFKLLEWQSISREDWAAWLVDTPYVETVRGALFQCFAAGRSG